MSVFCAAPKYWRNATLAATALFIGLTSSLRLPKTVATNGTDINAPSSRSESVTSMNEALRSSSRALSTSRCSFAVRRVTASTAIAGIRDLQLHKVRNICLADGERLHRFARKAHPALLLYRQLYAPLHCCPS